MSDIDNILNDLTTVINMHEEHTRGHGDVCYGKELKEQMLIRIAAQRDLIDCIRIQLRECSKIDEPEEQDEPEESDYHQAYGADPDDLEEWSSMPGWGEPAWYALRFIDSLKNFVAGCQNVQRTERTQTRLDFLETWRDATLERIKKWQALNKRLYKETIDE